MSADQCQLMNLPQELMNEIFIRLAKDNYISIYNLGGTCRYFREKCNEFVRENPPEKFTNRVVIAEPTSSDESDIYYDDNNAYDVGFLDDLDELVDDLEDNLSFGSGYSDNDDENLDYHLNQEWHVPDGDGQQVYEANRPIDNENEEEWA